MAHGKLAEMKKVVCNYHLNLSIKMKFFNTYIRSRLCYCCEKWILTKNQYERMEKVHIQFLVRGGMSRKSSHQIKKAKEAKKDWVEDEELIYINWAWKHTNEDFG